MYSSDLTVSLVCQFLFVAAILELTYTQLLWTAVTESVVDVATFVCSGVTVVVVSSIAEPVEHRNIVKCVIVQHVRGS